MKNYSPKIAAQKLVQANVEHGLSRHCAPQIALTKVTSVSSEKAHVSALTLYAKWLLVTTGRHLRNSSRFFATQYLQHIAQSKKQASISLARQAINLHLHIDRPISHVVSAVPTVPMNRAYSHDEVVYLCHEASPRLSLSIAIAAAAGLRGMELVSIAPMPARVISPRDWHAGLFSGREKEVRYSVHGKGGLVREVRLPTYLSAKLEMFRRAQPLRVSHRGAHLTSYFDLIGGHAFSSQFGRLSKRLFHWSLGGHGLRHFFAQRRRDQLLWHAFSFEDSLSILSQELGHFSSKNTFAYLRDKSYKSVSDAQPLKGHRSYFAYS